MKCVIHSNGWCVTHACRHPDGQPPTTLPSHLRALAAAIQGGPPSLSSPTPSTPQSVPTLTHLPATAPSLTPAQAPLSPAQGDAPSPLSRCAHFGADTGQTVECGNCPKNKTRLKLFTCGMYGRCTVQTEVPGIACCGGRKTRSGAIIPCPGMEPLTAEQLAYARTSAADQSRNQGTQSMRWAYGVTTVPDRIDSGLTARTLDSLKEGGYPSPRLFVDGASHQQAAVYEQRFGLQVTTRGRDRLRTYGNWVMALAELFIRHPACHRYAVFQDDFVCVQNLRPYLERVAYPKRGYLNLYTFPMNQDLPHAPGGFFRSNQRGLGAVALVFDRESVTTLLMHQHMVERPMDVIKGHLKVDGAIVESMHQAGWVEYVHDPSLVQHTGQASSMGNQPHLLAPSFPGESFDALTLLPANHVADPSLLQLTILPPTEEAAIRRALADDEERLKTSSGPSRRKLIDHINRYRELLGK